MAAGKKKNHSWVRVYGPDLDAGNKDRAKENKSILESENFKKVCELAGINPTKRQASKFKRKNGLAFMYGKSNKV